MTNNESLSGLILKMQICQLRSQKLICESALNNKHEEAKHSSWCII